MIASPRLRATEVLREPLVAAVLAGAGAALILAVLPLDGDAPAHLYRTLLVRHGVHIWDNLWFGGNYPLASYSALYYLPAALVGNVPLVLAAIVAAAALFASLATREWGERARWPARTFAVCTSGALVTGTYAYAAGFAVSIGALRAFQAGKAWLALLLAAVTLAFSPLAFVFLLLVLVAAGLVRRRHGRKAVVVVLALAGIAGIQAGALAVFPENSVYPGSALDLLGVAAVAALAAALARRADGGGVLVAFFVVWGLVSVACYFIPSPIGDNVTRLRYVVFPLVLLAALLVRFRPRALAFAAVACALAYNVVPYVTDVSLRGDPRAAEKTFWTPAVGYLGRHLGGDFRVEVVPTSEHWESYWVAAAGIPLARGWYRQIDYADNRILYQPLTARTYETWLRQLAVRYVVLPLTRVDPLGGEPEAKLLRSGGSGLTPVFRSATTVVYELPQATPILTPSSSGVVTRMRHEQIAGVTEKAGVYTLRVRYTPYWRVQEGDVCVSPSRSGMTRVTVRRPGRFELVLPEEAEAIVASLFETASARCGRASA